jgi:hypothetical protein
MSTVQKVNFETVSNLMHLQTRDFPLVDPDLANPFNANALVDGEWMTLTSANKMQRAVDVVGGSPGDAATLPSWPLWAERGRTDVQARGERASTLLYLGQWEFDTRIFNATSMVLLGRVSVAVIALGGKQYSGLVANGTVASPGSGITVGIITRLPATNGGKLRIRGGIFF